MSSDTSTTNVATLDPYTFPDLDQSKKDQSGISLKGKSGNSRKGNMIQIFPGKYEIVSYNKFLLLRFDDLTRPVNPFKANKEIINICGNSPKIRPQGDGSLVIEVSSPDESERLLKVTKVHGHKVSCIPHPTYNQSRGVIYAPELLTIDTEEIQSELKEQNVVKVVRIMKKVENGHIPLPTLILTFNSYRLLNIIKAGWLTFKVKPCIPSPLRCFHCQVFGHSIQKCKKKLSQEPAVCVNCGKAAHGECKDTPSCINCGGEHSASSKSCPRFIYEKEVQAIKVLEKVSFKEAKRRASEKQIRPGELFSSVIKNNRGQQNNQNITKENKSDRREQSENEVVEITRRKHPLTTKPIKNLVINSEPKNTSSENESDRREQSENEVVEITRRKHPLTTKPIKNLFINSEPKNTSSTSKHKTI